MKSWRIKPENSTTYAVGYPALSIETEVYQSNSISCSWLYDGDLNSFQFLTRGICVPLIKSIKSVIYCQIANNSIIAELRIDGPLQYGFIDVKLDCNDFVFLTAKIAIECKFCKCFCTFLD